MADDTITLEFLAEQRRQIPAEVHDFHASVTALRQNRSAILDGVRQLRTTTPNLLRRARP
jgi:uncharacterized coiled-coil DUF342 family protein